MKKALVVTYYAGANYGAFWQAYGIGEYLKKSGYSVKYLRDSQMEKALSKGEDHYNILKNKELRKAIDEYFSVSDEKKGYDLAVLGSDEIWNRESAMSSQRKAYWGKGICAKAIISYAPCAISTGWKRMFPKVLALRKLDGISVRDIASQEVVRKLTHREVTLVIDPTFLIDYDFIKKPIMEEPYILVYSYGLNDEQRNTIQESANERNLRIIVSGHEAAWADFNPDCSPEEWLSLFKCASYVYTTTFHGSVFSVIFEKEFSLLGNNPKACALLNSFGITVSEGHTRITRENYAFINEQKNRLLGTSLHYLNSFCETDTPKLSEVKNACCGCTACFSVCPKKAITMSLDEEGFLYPEINASRCIRCGKCLSVCAFKRDIANREKAQG